MRASVVTGWTPVSVGTADVAVAERAALGTSVRVAAWPAEDLGSALTAVDIELARLEEQASRSRDDSELARINRGRSSVHQLSRGLAEAIGVALAAARWTGGLVDPTVGGALIALGYDRAFAAIGPGPQGPAGETGPAPGWRSVTLDGTTLGLPAWVRLDLGATAKGLGSDRAATAAFRARGRGRGGILVSLGGDIAVAGQPPLRRRPGAAGGGPRPRPGAGGYSVQPGRRHRRARPAAFRRLAGGRGRLLRSRRRTSGPGRQAYGRRTGHVIGHLPPVATGRAAAAPHHRPPYRVAGSGSVADSERRRGQLRRGQCRRHRRDRGGPRRGSVAGSGRAAGPASGSRRHRAAPGRLAGLRPRTGPRTTAQPAAWPAR